MDAETLGERQGVGFIGADLAQESSSRIDVSQIAAVGRECRKINRDIGGVGGQPDFLGESRLKGAGNAHAQVQPEANRRDDHEEANRQKPPAQSCDDGGLPCGRRLAGKLDRCKKAVAATSQGFDETGVFCRVAQGVAETLDGGVETVVEIDKGVGWPQAGAEVFASDDLAGALKEHGQNPEGLVLEVDP